MDIKRIRTDFPILETKNNGHQVAYFDNAASSQRPKKVVEAMSEYYYNDHSNIHRGIHFLGERATLAYETARKKVASFINSKENHEIIFTANVTAAINLLANSYVGNFLNEGDTIVVSKMEHHSNLIPWQMIAERKKLKLKFLDLTEDGRLNLDNLDEILSDKNVKFLAITHVSNVLGTINDVKTICSAAKKYNVTSFIDAAQSVPHLKVDVQDIGCDFLAFTGHKMCGPTGIGVLYGKADLLEKMPPFLGGGGMVDQVFPDQFTPAEIPERFEAGTPPIAEAVGLAAAIDYLADMGMDKIKEHEEKLTKYILSELKKLDFIKIFGSQDAKDRIGVISFQVDGAHPHDVSEILSKEGICCRAGHHCAHTLMAFLDVPATTRASLYFYNTEEEIDRFVECLKKVYVLFN